MVAATIEHLAPAVALGGDLERGAVLEGDAHAALERQQFVREFAERTTYNALTSLLRDKLARGELSRLLAKGAALAPEAAIELALE